MRRTALAVVLVAAPLLLSGCGRNGPMTASDVLPPFPSETPGASAAADRDGSTAPEGGGASPEEVVEGLLAAIEAGDAVAACTSVVPAERADCEQSLEGVPFSAKDHEIGSVAEQGDQAIVTFTSTAGLCFAGFCTKNDDPDAGQPGDGVSFAQALKKTTTEDLPVFVTRRVDGRWYATVLD